MGGGAAGFFTAINAAVFNPQLRILIIEKTSKLLSKVKVSGGGRCNVTHACFNNVEMTKNYPRGATFLKSAFHYFGTKDTIEWFRQRGVELKTESDGRMFPESNTSQTIIDCLIGEVNKYNIEVMMNTDVEYIEMLENQFYNFNIICSNKRVIEANSICIACGGYHKSSSYDWLKKTGHHIEDPVPSLFTFNIPNNNITKLMGISVADAAVKIAGKKIQQRGPLLITHWGLSGPAVLKLSAWGARDLAEGSYDFTAIVSWLPDFHEQSLIQKMQLLRLEMASQKIYNRNPFDLPARLWEYFLSECEINKDLRWADLPSKLQNKLAKIICSQEFSVKGKTTFKEEFVTAGGIMLNEINPATMESKLVKGLFFSGEILNVDGVTGGFNFQNAWTTGWIAAKCIAEINQ